MKCPNCRTPMVATRENHRWDASGLPNVVLVEVEVRRCPACDEEAVVIPRIEELHRALAMTLIDQPGRLTPHEIRYLRKWLGWSGQDFAHHFGVTATSVSRWENIDNPTPMGGTADRLLRMLVARGQPIDEYPVSKLTEIDDSAHPARMIGLKAGRSGWEPSPLAA